MNHVLFRCLQCQKDLPTSNPVVVTQLGFWPGSVSNMTYVFDPEVFFTLGSVPEGKSWLFREILSYISGIVFFKKRKGMFFLQC